MRSPTTLMLLVVVLSASIFSGVAASADPTLTPERDARTQAAVLHPNATQTMTEIQGSVQSVDSQAKILRFKDATGHSMKVTMRPDTRILDDQNRALTLASLHLNDPIRVYYNQADNTAEQVDRLPTVSDVVSGRQ